VAEAQKAEIRMGTSAGWAVVAATTLGSGMTLLDGTVVNVALRTIGADLDASLADLQWITNGYLLTLASLILLGGALGDRFGRRRVFVWGTVWFALASLACGLAPTPTVLVVARLLQGMGAALLTPGSLAIISSVFVATDRGRAIGAWSGLGAIAAAVGPFLGGGLVEYASWRWIFLINLPLAALTVVLARRHVPETLDPDAPRHFDVAGAVLASVALGGITWALIDWGRPVAVPLGVVGLLAAVAFVVVEHREREPMLPLTCFADRVFSAANAMTLLVYAALGAIMFFLVIQLQTVGGYGPLAAGISTLPVTLCMVLLAARAGDLGTRIGPRIPMTVGPMVMAGGALLLLKAGEDVAYLTDVLPGITVFGLGLALMVAPLTATVLAAAPEQHVGIASGVNNAIARAGSLLAVAALPPLVGLAGEEYADPRAFDAAYDASMVACAVLLVLGGLVSAVLVPGRHDPVAPEPAETG
jgi:EmrB/QacA subfamily drug resistance transporter